MSRQTDKQVGGLAAEIGERRPFDSIEQETFLNLARTFECFVAEFHRLFASFDLTEPQYNALRILRGHGRPMQVYRIAEQMITRQPDITRLIDRLEQAKLASRQRCKEDRRVVWVAITAAGDKLLAKLDGPVLELHAKQFGHLGAAKLKTLSRLLFEARGASAAAT